MTKLASTSNAVEPERYELREEPAYHFDLARREFFRLLGGGIVVFSLFQDLPAPAQESGGRRRGGFGGAVPQEIGAWLHIDEEGGVNVFTGKVEVGQNIRTSLSQAVAEELRVPIASIHIIMADTERTPFDMGTFGSRTTPTMNRQLRRAAVAARELLLDLAAGQWKAERGALVVAEGKITDPKSGQSLSFGQLAKGQKLMQSISEDVALTPATQWKIEGTSVPKVNGREIVTGEHRYTADIKRPGMLYGKILRPPAFQAKLTSLDTHKAEGMTGVTIVHDGDFVGVAAPDSESAEHALEALQAEWKTTPQLAGKELFAYFKRPQGNEPDAQNVQGSMEQGLAAADKKLQATYTVAYIAHAPLEPRAAVAEWEGDKLTVWTGTQRPFGVRGELVQAFHLSEDKVRVIVPDTGSGYGGKHTGETAIEAARLAKAAGRPVKVLWTREEEFTWAYFRPAGVMDVVSGVQKDGMITAWEYHNYNSGASGIGTLYAIPNQRIMFHPVESPLRQGSYRGLSATANHFARESHIDELAHAVQMDPLAFRLKNLQDVRLRAVLEAAAERFGWGKTKPAANQGVGIAVGFEKGGYVATCAEVAVERMSGRVRILRVVTAFDCGAVVNPDGLINQIEGAVIMSIGGALFEAIEFDNGKILNPHFSRYRVPRFRDVPAIEVVLVDRKDQPSAGAGETPIVGLAPAVGNAIFAATSIRLRSLPMTPQSLKQA
jgi:isoquinoline 1-oxidoreductase